MKQSVKSYIPRCFFNGPDEDVYEHKETKYKEVIVEFYKFFNCGNCFHWFQTKRISKNCKEGYCWLIKKNTTNKFGCQDILIEEEV